MKLGIISDSHENMPKIRKAVNLFNRSGVETVLHAGDIISPITAKEFSALACRFVGVFGNNDGDRLFLRKRFRNIGTIHVGKFEGKLGGKRLLLIHEPDMLDALAASGAYDIIVYGHTHQAEISLRGSTLVINPGEAGGWITGKSTVALLDTASMKARLAVL
ncbi:MAG TPA: metallophosphoesterase [Prolixibacteraceae bacterium]|nr:metallophosphoesterase [bacterium]HPJ80021.1 metallophosphoesterase [Prolixibacteraceae bacterium]HPQ66991.1 metallophosphoesterase [bacterium]